MPYSKIKYSDIHDMKAGYVLKGFDKSLEKKYFDDNYYYSLKLIRFSLIMSFLLVAGFGILDFWMLPLHKHTAWLMRFAFACPYILFCVISTFFGYFKRFIYLLLSFCALITAASITVMIAAAQQKTEPAISLYFAGLMLVGIALNAGCFMRFVYALPVNFLILIMYETAAIFFNKLFSSPQSIAVFINNNFFLISSEILGLIACFFIEYFMRRTFLLQEKIRNEELLKRTRAMENLKTAYGIYKDLDSEMFINNLKKTLNKKSVEEYVKKLKNDQIASGIIGLIDNISVKGGAVDMFDKINDIVLEISGAEKIFVFIKDNNKDTLELISWINPDNLSEDFPLKIATEVFNSGKALTINDIWKNDAFLHKDEALNNKTSAILCFPIKFENIYAGAYYLDTEDPDSFFKDGNAEMIIFLIDRIALSLGTPPWKDSSGNIVIDAVHFDNECSKFGLSAREKEILSFVIKGLSNKEICEKFFISMNTLRTHLKNIYAKLGVSDRDELFSIFIKYRIE